jgi:ketosteroid isomerase-like protein
LEDNAMTVPLQDINNDIWLPFRHAYATGDVESYLALHAPEFVWIDVHDGIIEGLDDYAARIRQSFAGLPAGISLRLDFRFTERIANAHQACERGISRMSGDGPRGPLPVRYTRFHTTARHAGGGWRLTMDYQDRDHPSDAHFHAAHPIDDLEPFTAKR